MPTYVPSAGDTIVAIATGSGRAGIGIVRVSGGDIDVVVQGVLGRIPPERKAAFSGFRSSSGAVIDQGLALYFVAPHSYTGETVLELHGHGGPAVLQLILHRCLELGARIAQPGEFTLRAFLNNKLDLAQAEGVADLIEASTATAAKAAARSLTGEFSNEIRQLVNELIELRAYTEATLDFPEEEIEFLRSADVVNRLTRLRRRVGHIVVRAEQGRRLREGLNVVLIGAPNVGKSSLLNQLAGEEVAIVSPIPGTTRDTVRENIEVGGVPLHVIDTAGLRKTSDPIESIGIERTRQAIATADLALVITTSRASAGEAQIDHYVTSELPTALPRITVINKTDLDGLPAGRTSDAVGPVIRLSAKTGEGVDLLRKCVGEVAGVYEPGENLILARARHLAMLTTAADHLVGAEVQLALTPMPIELFAEELRGAQQALSSIVGEFSSDDLLGTIFGRFCIGK